MTALTRLFTSVSHLSPSLRKIEWITFSTDRSVRTSASAIAALFFPSAISRSTSRSRGVSSLSGDSSLARVLRHQRLDDLRVDHRATVRDGVDRGDELVEIVDALLQEVGAPLRCRPPGARAHSSGSRTG